ncbi:precorrin-4 C(11)-methyltransferase [Bacteriovoracales bacterium]|nr:precorrin-4 C(11)-methyltransferase [Bacteriovoracales bacterium]
MKVYIIGAGPGDPDLITVKGCKLVETCPIVFYTGSLVPKAVIERAKDDSLVLDSSGMDLDEIMEVFKKAKKENKDVARVHTGDPMIYGSTAEQMRRLDDLEIEWEVIPGVSSFVASAAAIGKELTLPETSQTIILTRMEGRTPMPEGEKLADLAKTGATLALFLSVGLIKKVVDELKTIFDDTHPVIVVQRASWPDQKIVRGDLSDIVKKVKNEKIKSTAIILTGKVFNTEDFPDSRLYASDFTHNFRQAKV